MSKKIVSLVIPIYFEQDLIPELYARLLSLLSKALLMFECEIIFVNDGSTDNSSNLLREICIFDNRFKLINLSRNFGHQLAITAGIDHAIGDAVIVMDGDLQDPPELIPKFLEKWAQGYQVVYAIREARAGETYLKKLTASLFYILLDKLTDIKIPRNVGDFRLMDRCVVKELSNLRESSRYIRGLVSWIGFRQCGVYYSRDARYAGKTKYSLSKMLKLAIDGIVNFSEKPLYIASYVGFFISFVSIIWGISIFYNYFSGNFVGVLGWSSIMVSILFIGGLQIAFIGLIGLYLGRTYGEVRGRPLYVISDKIGFVNA